jgi:nucleotide-binding universal stress UspA family protein
VVELARRAGAQIEVLRTALSRPYGKGGVRECEEYLAGVAERLAAEGCRDVRVSVWEGDPVGAVLKAARRSKIDLIVMTTHGRRGLRRLALGSVAEGVVRRARTPLLLVPRPDASAARSKEPDAWLASPR